MLASTGSAAKLRSCGGIDATRWFPEVVAAIANMPAGTIFEGEVCPGRSRTKRLHRLHPRARRKG